MNPTLCLVLYTLLQDSLDQRLISYFHLFFFLLFCYYTIPLHRPVINSLFTKLCFLCIICHKRPSENQFSKNRAILIYGYSITNFLGGMNMEKSQKHGNKVILVGDGAVGSSYAYALVLQRDC